MIIALPTLVFIQDAIFSAIGRLVRPYYKSFSLTFKRKDEEDDDQVFAEYDEEKGVIFFPPMFAQRYATFSDCLMDERWSGQLEKIVDFGYNDMSFIRYIKEMPGVKTIVGVDLDSIPLRCSSDLLGVNEYVPKRETPIQVMLFQGNAADPDYRLIGTDAVVAIELIEHMLPHDLDRFVHTIFGFIKPRIAVISTPNGDFNVLFKSLESNGFRRLDHFFEWSREQFHDWCSNIVERYPGYTVTCQGIGPGPEGTSHLGCCSQMALFVAKNYRKQMEFTVNSLALVAQAEQNYYYVNSESGDTDNSSQQNSTELQVHNYHPDILQRQTLMIYMSGPLYASYDDLENCDKTSQCDLDSEIGKSYLMKSEEVAMSGTSVIVPRRRNRYHVYEIGNIASRLNCTTLQARKFSKTTQNLMTKNRLDSLMHTKEVVDEIKSLARMLNLDRTAVAKKHSHIWNNINWGDNAPYWNEYYKLVKEFSYPFEVVSEESRILDVITDEINRLIDEQFDEDYEGYTNNYHNKLEIPIEYLLRKVRHITSDVGKVREVLEWNGYEIVDDVVIYTRMISEEASLDDVSSNSNNKDAHSNDNRDELGDFLSDNSGVSIRRAIDRKIQKLRSTLTADEDISFEMDRVVCQLVRLSLRTNRHRATPIPTRWLLLKLYDLLTLNIKAIEKKRIHFNCHYQGSVPVMDDIEDNKSDVTHTIDKSYVIENEDTNSYITQIVENLANNFQTCDISDELSDQSITLPDIQLLDNIPEETFGSHNFDDDQDANPRALQTNTDYNTEAPNKLEINLIDLNELNQYQTDTELLEYSAEYINQRYDMLRGEVDNGLIEDLAKMTLRDLDLDQVQELKKLMEYSYEQSNKDMVHIQPNDIEIMDCRESDPNFSYPSLRLKENELGSSAVEPYRIELSKLDLKQLDQYELELYRLDQSFDNNKLYAPHLNAIKDRTYDLQQQIDNKVPNEDVHVYDNVTDFLCHSNFFETLKKYREDNTALEIMKKYKDIINSDAETEDECEKCTKESGVFDADNFSYLSSNVFSNGNSIGRQPESGGPNLSGETNSYVNRCDDSGNENFKSQINESLSSSSTDTLDAHSQCESVSSEHTSKNDAFECECDSWIEQNIDDSGTTYCRSTDIHTIASVDIKKNAVVPKKKEKKNRKNSKSNLVSKSGKKAESKNWNKSQNKVANSNKFVANGANIITENIQSNQVALDIQVKKDDITICHIQSKVTKPIPGEMTTYCQSNTETVQKIIEISDIFSKGRSSNVQANGNVADTEASMFIEIVTDDLCETISLRRTIGTSFDDIDNISEHEVIHDEVLLDSIHNTECHHSAENFQTQSIAYDLDQPSTSKSFRLVTNEVQCGPDIAKSYSYNPNKKDTETSTHNYDFCSFSPLNKRDKMGSTCQVGIKIKDSDENLHDQTNKSQETAVNVQTEFQLYPSREKTNVTYSNKSKIELKREPSPRKTVSSQLIDLKAPECENSKIDDIENYLSCSLESLPMKLPKSLNKGTDLDTDLISNNDTPLKLQRGGVCIHSYKDKKEDVMFQGEWQKHRTSSLSPERHCSRNMSSRYLSESSMKKLRSSSTPIYLRNKSTADRGQPKKVNGITKPLKVQLTKSISKEKLMKLPSDVIAKLNRLSCETRYLSDTTMKRANELKLKEKIKIKSVKSPFNSPTRRLMSCDKRPLTGTKTVIDKNNQEPMTTKRPNTASPVKNHEVQQQRNMNKLKIENSTKKAVAARTTKRKAAPVKNHEVQRQSNMNKLKIEIGSKKAVAARTTKRKSATKLSYVTSKTSKDRVVKKATSKTSTGGQNNFGHKKRKQPVPYFQNQTEENPKPNSSDLFMNKLSPTLNNNDLKGLNPLQKLFEHNLNFLLYRTEMNVVNSTEKSPSPTSKHSPDRSPSPLKLRSTPKKSISPISLIKNLEKNEDETLGSPDCSSVNSVCTVKEIPRCSKSPDPITITTKRKHDDSPRINSKKSKIPRLMKPIHKKLVDPNTASTSNSSTSRLSKDSTHRKKCGIPRPTKHPIKTSTPFGTPVNNIIIAQVATADTSSQGFKLHTKVAVEIDRENVDSKLKNEPKSNKQKNSPEAPSSSSTKAIPTSNTEIEDKLSGQNVTTEIKVDTQKLTNNMNDTNVIDHDINVYNQTESAVDVYNTNVDLSPIFNSEPRPANEECGTKVNSQEVLTPAVFPGTESIADTMFTITDTDVISFRSISSDNEFTEAHESLDNSTEIQDIFDRRKHVKNQTPPQGGTLATQVFSGYSVDGPNVGDCQDHINMIDSETGSIAAGTARMAVSEEVFVSGRSSESCQLSPDAVVPDWLFSLIDHQNRASGGEHQIGDDEEPLLLQIPPNLTNNVVPLDLNGNVVVEGLVGAAAGAGDGRGIYSVDSSGRGSSLSSTDDDGTSRADSEAASEQSTYQSTSADIQGTSSGSTLHLRTSNMSSALDDEQTLQTETNSAFNQSLPYSSSGCDADVSSNDTDLQN